jgi:hypothetical protein
MEMTAAVQKMTLREELKKRWEAESPEEILRSYEDSLKGRETTKVEVFESYAEEILERKGNYASVAAFRERAAREIDSRLTPVQLKAKEELLELKSVGSSLHAIFQELMSNLTLTNSSENNPCES